MKKEGKISVNPPVFTIQFNSLGTGSAVRLSSYSGRLIRVLSLSSSFFSALSAEKEGVPIHYSSERGALPLIRNDNNICRASDSKEIHRLPRDLHPSFLLLSFGIVSDFFGWENAGQNPEKRALLFLQAVCSRDRTGSRRSEALTGFRRGLRGRANLVTFCPG